MSVITFPLFNQNAPFLFDQENMQAIADPKTIKDAHLCYSEHRVISLDFDNDFLSAEISENEDKDEFFFQVNLWKSEDGISAECDCIEIAEDENCPPCRHILAALFACSEKQLESDKLMSAADTAVRDRIKRGINEVRVAHVRGDVWFGTWQAASINQNARLARNYEVTIRSLDKRANLCTCPDFTTNQLGTCKHIEAVLHKIKKSTDYEKLCKSPTPVSYIYLAWDVDDAPQIMLCRGRKIEDSLAAVLNEYFLASGEFKGRLPDDFFRLRELLQNNPDLHIGPDAQDYALQLAADAAHQARATEIRSSIRAGRGKLPGVKARLYPYQVDGVAFLAGTGRALLADDMGLGKTLQSIAAAAWLSEHSGVRRTLIVCPASLKHQWAREITKFTDKTVQVIQGPVTTRGVQYRSQTDFVVVNYELVIRDLNVINSTLNPDLLILDEAQRIKNWRTQISTAVKRIDSRFAFVLSGTPLENRLEDLYSLMQVVDPKVLGPLWRYMVDFHITDQRGKILGYRNLSLLRKRLAPVMLRRDRSLVSSQLPERITQRIDVPMTSAQVDLHDSAMAAAGRMAQIAAKRPLTPSEQNKLLASLQQARMACDAAGLVDKETKGSPKLDELESLLEELCLNSNRKAVVFSQWEMMTRMIEERLRRMKIGSVRLHGGIPTAKRGQLMDTFREDDSVQVFVSTDAGGVGLNLQSGSVLINMDVPWNPAVLEQRNARIHRLGQTRTVQIITMIAADGYENHVFSLVKNKQNLFDNVIKEDATEDVVGVSAKLLETLLKDLQEVVPGDTEKEDDEVKPTPSPDPESNNPEEVQKREKLEKKLTQVINTLQEQFGPRIERIMGSGGGLIAVLDRVEDRDDRLAEELSETVPTALIDQTTLKGLQRLGDKSPLSITQTYFDAREDQATGQPSRLGRIAREKLKAARLLLDQEMASSALDLICTALLTAAADMAGENQAVTPENATLWTYSTAVPAGVLTHEDAAVITRAVGLAQAQEPPLEMVEELFDKAREFMDE